MALTLTKPKESTKPVEERPIQDEYEAVENYDPIAEAKDEFTAEKAWILARKILKQYTNEETAAIFGQPNPEKVIMNLSAIETKHLYDDYERRNTLVIGDQVRAYPDDGEPYLYWVTFIDGEYINGMEDNGRVRCNLISEVHKTGKHKEITTILDSLENLQIYTRKEIK